MSSTSALECHEDMETILVRMEDVQPDRSSDVYILDSPPFVLNSVTDHDYSCVFDDEDSNIGSMVSIHSEEVEDYIETVDKCKTSEFIASNPDSWPTLEILPGGVIKHSEKYVTSLHQNNSNKKEMVYACAKCPQKFKFLYNLVKHVKLHEEEQKKLLLNKQKFEGRDSKSSKLPSIQLRKKKEKRKYRKSKLPKKS